MQARRLPTETWYRIAFLVLGGALAAIPIVGFSAHLPTVFSPFPAPFTLAIWILGYPTGLLLATLLPVAFWMFSHQLARGEARIPLRGRVLLFPVTALAIIWTLYGYRHGAAHQGALYARTIVAINIAMPLLLTVLFQRNRRSPSYGRAFAYQWLLWAWIGSYAFAYLGELP